MLTVSVYSLFASVTPLLFGIAQNVFQQTSGGFEVATCMSGKAFNIIIKAL
jgi:hypothetical protein